MSVVVHVCKYVDSKQTELACNKKTCTYPDCDTINSDLCNTCSFKDADCNIEDIVFNKLTGKVVSCCAYLQA